MEGFSTITYKDKKIFYIDYSSFGLNIDKAIRLLRFATQEYQRLQLPPKSVLAIANISGLYFNSELINAFKEEKEKTSYYKKIAVIGLKGLQRLRYKYITHLNSKDSIKIFKT